MQRLKGAFDSLEEQARQRPNQPSPSPRPSVPRRAPAHSATSTSRASSLQRGPVPDKATESSGPDPDPSAFDPDLIAGRDELTAGAHAADAAVDRDGRSSAEKPSDRTAPVLDEIVEANGKDAAAPRPSIPDLPDDVQGKLRKLNRLETKYGGKLPPRIILFFVCSHM